MYKRLAYSSLCVKALFNTFNKEKAIEGPSANIVKTMHMDVSGCYAAVAGWAGYLGLRAGHGRPVCSGPSLAQPRPASAGLYSAEAGPGPGQTTITIILHINSIPRSCSIRHFHAATTKRTCDMDRVKIRAINESSRSFTLPGEVPYYVGPSPC